MYHILLKYLFFCYFFFARASEVVALVSLSTTVFLFLRTRTLSNSLREPYEQQPSGGLWKGTLSTHTHREVSLVFSSLSLAYSGSSALSGSSGFKPKTRELNTLPEFPGQHLDASELNNTRKAKADLLFFNRVPKVGSQTTMELLKMLSIKNNFHYHKDRTQKVETIKLSHSEEVRVKR